MTMTTEAVQVRVLLIKKELEFWESVAEKKSCSTCHHFNCGLCREADDSEPPAEIQPTGCGEWVWDGIVF